MWWPTRLFRVLMHIPGGTVEVNDVGFPSINACTPTKKEWGGYSKFIWSKSDQIWGYKIPDSGSPKVFHFHFLEDPSAHDKCPGI